MTELLILFPASHAPELPMRALARLWRAGGSAFLAFLLSAVVAAPAAFGQATADDKGDVYFGEQEMFTGKEMLGDVLGNWVLSASKQEQRQEDAPAKVAVITAEQIRLRGYVDLESILHDLAGFDFDKGMGVDWSTIFMRGFRSDNSDRFLLIWDGVIQNDTWKQSNWLSRQYPLTNVERIEVMYGPSSLLYGANAFSGIINVILRTESVTDGAQVSAFYGSYNTSGTELNFGKEVKNWRFMANGRFYKSDEMDFNGEYWVDNVGRKRYYSASFPAGYAGASDPSYALDVENGQLYWTTNGKRTRFNSRMEQETKDWFLQAGVGYKGFNLRAFTWYREESEGPWYTPQKRINGVWIPTGSALTLAHDMDVRANGHSRIYAIWRQSGIDEQSRDASFKSYFTGDVADPRELLVYQLRPDTYYYLDNEEVRVGNQLNYVKEALAAVLGAEYTVLRNSEDYNMRAAETQPWKETPRHDERNAAVFGNAQARVLETFSLTAGLRYDYNYLQGESGGFGSLYTARVAGILTPADGQYVKLIYGQAFQAPDSWHKFSTDAAVRPSPSPDLDPERLGTFEVTYGARASDLWDGSLSAYHSTVEGVIGTESYEDENGDTVTRFANLGSLRILGAELESRFFLGKSKSVYANVTVTRTLDTVSDREPGDIAPVKANAGTDLLFGDHIGVSLRGHYVSERDTVTWDRDSIYSKKTVGSYATCDLTLSWLDLFRGADARLSVFNLLDTDYYDPAPRSADGVGYNAAILQQGFRAFLGLSYRYQPRR
ncbi:MAG: TonB-dependent receptor plug domain-containing protein [Candidatus Schekmanbacteria bacterium]|nr:TonB-dependent receptor plug domain-containing protein [Candidatus Schekmanbacteria bacterium]